MYGAQASGKFSGDIPQKSTYLYVGRTRLN